MYMFPCDIILYYIRSVCGGGTDFARGNARGSGRGIGSCHGSGDCYIDSDGGGSGRSTGGRTIGPAFSRGG